MDLLSKQTVLVVDDCEDNIELVANILSPAYRVKVAKDGQRALNIIYSDSPPDLILLDVMMPGMSGYDVCKRIKANPGRRKIPVIFVTARCSIEDEALGLSLGAVDYITKPISPPILLARVRTHLALYDQTRELEQMVSQRTTELVVTRQQIIQRLGRAAEFRDNETGNHVVRVSCYAGLIAKAYGLSEEDAELIASAAPMHDIGKIGIPDAILLKPTSLSDDEWHMMHTHPAIGAEIIGTHDHQLLQTARTIALTHHENWDGSGYPHGLVGDDIPLSGRVVAVADVFDALLSVRPYKAAFTVDQALCILRQETGRKCEPAMMAAFDAVLDEILRVRELYPDEA